jgi:hypothetical protein
MKHACHALAFTSLISLSTTLIADESLSYFAELSVLGPYGVGIGAGAFYDKPDVVKYIDGFWGGITILRVKEEGVYEDYTETTLDLHGGVTLDIPPLRSIDKLSVFTGISVGRRGYTYLEEDYSEVIFGPIVGAMYDINSDWTAGGAFSFMTSNPRLYISYKF